MFCVLEDDFSPNHNIHPSYSTDGHSSYAMLCYAKSLQSCPTLCDPIDGSPPGSPVPGILQVANDAEFVDQFSTGMKKALVGFSEN